MVNCTISFWVSISLVTCHELSKAPAEVQADVHLGVWTIGVYQLMMQLLGFLAVKLQTGGLLLREV